MAATINSIPGLSDEANIRLNEAALTENRTVAEILEDAVKTYLDDRSWAKMFEYGRERAKAAGYEGEDGADRAIAEYRAAKRGR